MFSWLAPFFPVKIQIILRHDLQKLAWADVNTGMALCMVPQTTGDRTGLATGSSLYKKHVLRNWLVYVILSKTT